MAALAAMILLEEFLSWCSGSLWLVWCGEHWRNSYVNDFGSAGARLSQQCQGVSQALMAEHIRIGDNGFAAVEPADCAHLLLIQLKVKDVDVLCDRPGFDLGIATKPSWMCQRSTTCVGDLP